MARSRPGEEQAQRVPQAPMASLRLARDSSTRDDDGTFAAGERHKRTRHVRPPRGSEAGGSRRSATGGQQPDPA